VRKPSIAARSAIGMAVVLCAAGVLAGCGSGIKASANTHASADVDASTPGGCPATVLEALGGIAMRVYREGVASERTGSALHLISASIPLRKAMEAGDPRAARAAARALIATGHMTNLRVMRGGRVLAGVGSPGALAPLSGTLPSAAGAPIGTFVASVWADAGLIAETNGIAEGQTVLRAGGRTIAGAIELPPGELPAHGTLIHDGVPDQYTSYPATAYPGGNPLRVYLLRTISSTTGLCGATDQDTLVNTISLVARRIYEGEAGRRTLTQVHRVQQNQPLLRAVAQRNPAATRLAIEALLHEHIVRLRVSAGGRLLADVGGPYVLAPVSAPLRLGGRTIGKLVLSIQDDEGYKRLAERLVGLDVVMYMGPLLVKSTLGPSPGAIPTSGSMHYRGGTFRAYTFIAEAFPSGPLRITVLIPIPYS
jgi:hypothetical protein